MRNMILLTLVAAGIASCATVPAPLQGQFTPVSPGEIAKANSTGQVVRWGGDIITVKPKADETCFEILDRDLNAIARPSRRDTSHGRFIACRSGFYDPEIFKAGREATVVGHVTGTQTGRVGEYDYTYPVVAADAIYLWPEQPVYPRGYYDNPYFYDPFWGSGFWGYGSFGWGQPVIVVPRGHFHARPPPPTGH
ncbi:MAG: Slp family lipoprotein [Rhodanobacteraceae bacterium]